MKQQDLAIIIVIIVISGIVSFVISGKLISPSKHQQMVEVVPAINPTFAQPDSKYFNSNSIDPTKQIQIGSNSNQSPFSNSTNQ